MPSLTSTIRDLARRKARERRGLALAEGIRLVEEALAAGIPIKGAAVAPALAATPRGVALEAALTAAGVRLEPVDDRTLTELADTDHPQGVVAVIEPRHWSLEHISMTPGSAVLVLDAVQDPGNVGTMLRTAFALGAAGVVALPGTADLANSKVLRGSMGAVFRLPSVAAEPGELLSWAAAHNAEILVTEAGGEPISRLTPHAPRLLVLGNEGAGVGDIMRASATRRVGIPLAPGAESLNVAIAAGILLYEVLRAD